MIHRAAALADLFHPLCSQPGQLLRIVDPVLGRRFFDGLLGVGRLYISDQSGGCGADARVRHSNSFSREERLGMARIFSAWVGYWRPALHNGSSEGQWRAPRVSAMKKARELFLLCLIATLAAQRDGRGSR
jgi:hypothetical protein